MALKLQMLNTVVKFNIYLLCLEGGRHYLLAQQTPALHPGILVKVSGGRYALLASVADTSTLSCCLLDEINKEYVVFIPCGFHLNVVISTNPCEVDICSEQMQQSPKATAPAMSADTLAFPSQILYPAVLVQPWNPHMMYNFFPFEALAATNPRHTLNKSNRTKTGTTYSFVVPHLIIFDWVEAVNKSPRPMLHIHTEDDHELTCCNVLACELIPGLVKNSNPGKQLPTWSLAQDQMLVGKASTVKFGDATSLAQSHEEDSPDLPDLVVVGVVDIGITDCISQYSIVGTSETVMVVDLKAMGDHLERLPEGKNGALNAAVVGNHWDGHKHTLYLKTVNLNKENPIDSECLGWILHHIMLHFRTHTTIKVKEHKKEWRQGDKKGEKKINERNGQVQMGNPEELKDDRDYYFGRLAWKIIDRDNLSVYHSLRAVEACNQVVKYRQACGRETTTMT
ncbi:hypothetical protein DFH07DRAFT_785682 [Mycena maculata]|uniref:Uncharacterized protein n=1 Tax=Mycena maculata TaxID=230809 RepID=A0AAD7H9U8_9AGAR|nr:hypothetical protein DFH07DRAFT_785682 [Mycena maculata]